jgi:RNA polymerase sigma-54 factor
MKQSLSLRIGQTLKMTPQLQQAIRLLQLSSLDLQQEIQENLDANPMLELEEDDDAGEVAEAMNNDLQAIDEPAEPDELAEPDSEPPTEAFNDDFADDGFATPTVAAEDQATLASVDTEFERPIPEELAVDTNWDDIYPSTPAPSGSNDDQDWDFNERNPTTESLQDHLLWQLNLTPMSDIDRLIATTIIDAIDADGMLTLTVEDINQSLNDALMNIAPPPVQSPQEPEQETECGSKQEIEHGSELATEFEIELGTELELQNNAAPLIELDEVVAVLKRIQQFDPTGVAARDLAECLSLQLTQMAADTPWRDDALNLVTNHLDVLAARDFNTLKRKTRLTEEELASVVQLIQSLNPRPGGAIDSAAPEYITPDVRVSKKNGRWVVELNNEATPRLRINNVYANMVKRADNSAENTFLKDNLQEAKWFLKSLQSRNETLLKVATKIVEHQRGFLDYSEEAMKPLVLAEIAEAVEMHESTISRVTSRKYIDTPGGIFELKYFFSSHVLTNTGGEVSSTAIRALIKKLIADENPRKPLSDNKIAAILAEQNIKIARRTVAKYRESIAIPPSNERKRLV